MSFESLVALCPSIQVFTVGDGAEFFSFNEQMAYKATSGLGLLDLTAVSGWKLLRRCLLFIDLDDHLIDSIPSVENRPPAPYREFAETFVVLKDPEFLSKLRDEWTSHLQRLERIEVIAAVYDFTQAEKIYRPLIFGADCGLGRLHFTN